MYNRRTTLRTRLSMPGSFRLLFLLLLLSGAPAFGATPPLCAGNRYPTIPTVTPPADDRIRLEADSASLVRDGVSHLEGHVVIRRKRLQLEADRADYDYLTGGLDARGRIRLLAPNLLVTGERIQARLRKEEADVLRARYFTTERANGRAERLQARGPRQLDLVDATFTTCDPEAPDWELGAGHIHLDMDSRQGTARNVVLRAGDVPVFWLPWIRFPIGDERLTGFLFPTFGNSDKLGVQVQTPFYWNIAPNYDATITPWYMEKRGTLLRGQFRYLHRRNRGRLDADWLGSDRVTGNERWGVRWQHQGNPASGWRTDIDYSKVSDSDYFNDFGASLDVTSVTHLQQRGALEWNGNNWEAGMLAQAFQTLNGSPSYERLPQLSLRSHYPERNRQLHFDLAGEWVRFAHPLNTAVRGDRLDLRPSLSLPVREDAGFVVPRLSWRYTRYALKNTGSGQPTAIDRELPTFSLDSGLFFERITTTGIQTLEPRLFYVYTPYRDQSVLPVLDTTYRSFGINEPVREDFFDGADRVEDANRLTALLTSRWLDAATGDEKLLVSIGQIRYFADRRVTLPGQPAATGDTSDFIARAVYRPDAHWNAAGDLAWNPEIGEFDTYNLRLAWTRDSEHRLHLDYRNTRDTLETAETGFVFRLTPRWRFDGRYLHDLRAGLALEKTLGVRYDRCCWALGLRGRERFINTSVEPERSIYFEVVLKGLAGVSTGP